jgi:hypothetical protein
MKFGHFLAKSANISASVGLCGQEIGHLAAVDSTVSKAGQDLSAQSPPMGKKIQSQFEAEFHFGAGNI